MASCAVFDGSNSTFAADVRSIPPIRPNKRYFSDRFPIKSGSLVKRSGRAENTDIDDDPRVCRPSIEAAGNHDSQYKRRDASRMVSKRIEITRRRGEDTQSESVIGDDTIVINSGREKHAPQRRVIDTRCDDSYICEKLQNAKIEIPPDSIIDALRGATQRRSVGSNFNARAGNLHDLPRRQRTEHKSNSKNGEAREVTRRRAAGENNFNSKNDNTHNYHRQRPTEKKLNSEFDDSRDDNRERPDETNFNSKIDDPRDDYGRRPVVNNFNAKFGDARATARQRAIDSSLDRPQVVEKGGRKQWRGMGHPRRGGDINAGHGEYCMFRNNSRMSSVDNCNARNNSRRSSVDHGLARNNSRLSSVDNFTVRNPCRKSSVDNCVAINKSRRGSVDAHRAKDHVVTTKVDKSAVAERVALHKSHRHAGTVTPPRSPRKIDYHAEILRLQRKMERLQKKVSQLQKRVVYLQTNY